MYESQTVLEATGQIIIGIYFIWMGAKNILLWDMNVKRTSAEGLPPVPTLLFGFTIQFTGAFLVLTDWNAKYGAILLIVFTILASSLFHRYWEMPNPSRRTYHFLLLSNNFAIIGGLLLLI